MGLSGMVECRDLKEKARRSTPYILLQWKRHGRLVATPDALIP